MAPLMPVWMPLGVLKCVSIFISFILLFVGVDLMLGSRAMKMLSRSMNKSVNLDNHVIASLNNLRKSADKEVPLDHTLLDTGVRIGVSIFLLVAAAMVFFMISMRF